MKKKVIVLTVVFLVLTSSAYGYIDPGAGSYLVQVLIAAFVGVSLGIRVYWKKIKSLFKKYFPGKDRENEKPGP